MSKVIKLDDEVSSILRSMRVDRNVAYLQSGQLDRKLYEKVDKALKALGGKWNRKAGGHVFTFDPRAAMGQAVDDGKVIDTKKMLGQFFTPADVASRMIDEAYLKPGVSILEPSCGDGRIVNEIFRSFGHGFSRLLAVDLDMALVDHVRESFGAPNFRVMRADFLEMIPANFPLFDRVIMNPPFNRGDDIGHISHALQFLKPGGRLVAICAGGPTQRAYFDQLEVETAYSWWEDLPDGTFKAEGTGVASAMIGVRLQDSAPAAPPIPRRLQDKAARPLPLLELIPSGK